MNLERVYWALNDKLISYGWEMPPSDEALAHDFLSDWSKTYHLMARIADKFGKTSEDNPVFRDFRERLDDYVIPDSVADIAFFGM